MKKNMRLILCIAFLFSLVSSAFADNSSISEDATERLSFLEYLTQDSGSGIALTYTPCDSIYNGSNVIGKKTSSLNVEIVEMTVLKTGDELKAIRLSYERDDFLYQCYIEPDEVDELIDTLKYARKYIFHRRTALDVFYRTKDSSVFECSIYPSGSQKFPDEVTRRISISFTGKIPIANGFVGANAAIWTENITTDRLLEYIKILGAARKML